MSVLRRLFPAVAPGIVLGALTSGLIVSMGRADAADRPASRPNFVVILCDDLGYGDPRCFNPEGKIATPALDRLAAEGMRFRDAHSGSAVCSPTRYGLITGRYAWRSRLKSGVLGGLSPRLIEDGRKTLPALLKESGYATACVGKWHLGMNWVVKEGKSITELGIESADQVHNVDYSQPTTNGPNAVGFDWYYGISASLDMVPYVFIENDRCTHRLTVEKSFPMMLGTPQPATRLGPAAAEFEGDQVLPTLTEQAVRWIGRQARPYKEEGTPFFLYLPLASPHTPILPTKDWQGKSGINPYADFVMQTDAAIGRVVQALTDQGIDQQTLVIVTSDNGCSPLARFEELLAKGHNPSGPLRGHKADIFEGGHRVPFLARWPAVIPAGTACDETIWLGDIPATCAEIVGAAFPDTSAEDSVSFLSLLKGQPRKGGREAIVHHSVNGTFAIRSKQWKLIFAPGSGGWSVPRPGRDDASSLPALQLYDLTADLGETKNRQADEPDVVDRLTALMTQYVAEGRSTPGPRRSNTTSVDFRKAGRDAERPRKKP